MASSLQSFFGFNGRVNRMTFWINGLICFVATFTLSWMFTTTTTNFATWETSVHISNKPVYYIAMIIVLWRMASIHVRRWQDQDKAKEGAVLSMASPILAGLFPGLAGSWIVIFLGLLALVGWGFMGFVPGDDGDNDYGPPPPEGQCY